MKSICNTLALLAITFAGLTTTQAQDPLPSWNETAPKKAIVAFVEKATKEGSPDFVPPADRIATFDNDGTQTVPGKAWGVIFRLYGPLEPWFDKTWRPGEIELVK